MSHNLSFKQMAAELFAASLQEICPSLVLIETRVGKLGFNIDVLSPFELHDEYIRLAQVRMKEKIKKGEPLYVREMLTSNAKEFLIHNKQKMRASLLDEEEPLSYVVSIGEYVNVAKVSPESDVTSIGALEIEKVSLGEAIVYQKKERQITSIQGIVFHSKEDLKEWRRGEKNSLGKDHLINGEKWGFFLPFEEGVIWLEEGVLLKNKIRLKAAELFKQFGFKLVEMEGSLWEHRKALVSFLKETPIVSRGIEVREDFGECGLKDLKETEVIWAVKFSSENEEKEERNIFLQIMQKWGRLFPLVGEIQEKSDGVVFEVKDLLGLAWETLAIERFREKGEFGFEVKIYPDLVLALLMEQFSEKELLKKGVF